MASTNICYGGMGSLGGNHTRKEFLDVMKKDSKLCSQYTKSLKCKSCKEFKRLHNNKIRKQIEAHKKNKTYKISKRKENLIFKLLFKCVKCQKKNTRKCTLKEYIDFSGAEVGKC